MLVNGVGRRGASKQALFRPPGKVKRDEDLSSLADWSIARLDSPFRTRTLGPKVSTREEGEGSTESHY